MHIPRTPIFDTIYPKRLPSKIRDDLILGMNELLAQNFYRTSVRCSLQVTITDIRGHTGCIAQWDSPLSIAQAQSLMIFTTF